MSINIKNPEVSRKAMELAHETGESLTEAVGKAIDLRLEQIRHEDRAKRIKEGIAEIQRQVREHAPQWWFTWDYDADLYDENGLPK